MSMSLKVIDGDNYMRNASLSLSSGEPLEVTCRASMNSLHTKCHLGSIFMCIFQFCISIACLFYVTVLNISNKIKCVKSENVIYCHLKPTVPFLLVSKVLKMFSEKVSTFPLKEEEEGYSLNFLQVVIVGNKISGQRYEKCQKIPTSETSLSTWP